MTKIDLLGQLRNYPITIVAASLISLLLGLVTAMLGVTIGPAMQILFQPTETVSLINLFGERLAPIVSRVVTHDEISIDSLFLALPFMLAILAVIRCLMSVFVYFSWERVSERIARDLRINFLDTFCTTPYHAHAMRKDANGDTELNALIANDISQLRQYIVRVYGSIPREVFQSVFLIATMLVLSPVLFFLFFLLVLPGLVLVGTLSKRLKRRAKRALDHYASLANWMEQRLLGIETIKHYNTENTEVHGMNRMADDLELKYYDTARTRAIAAPVMETIAVLAFGLILYLAARLIQADLASASVQMSFFACLAIVAQSVGKLTRYVNIRAESLAAFDRLEKELETLESLRKSAPKTRGPTHLKKQQGQTIAIRCEDLCVRYPAAENLALSFFNASFHYGKLTAIATPSGSGKSTLFKSVLGLLASEGGTISLNLENPTHSLPVCYMPQDVQLIPDSLAKNIAYPHENYDAAKAWLALEQAQIAQTLKDKHWDLETNLGSGQAELSGGEAQRLALSRVFYHDSPIVLVDECTSALDEITESFILESLKLLAKRGRCILMIAHRPAAMSHADIVIRNFSELS